MPWKGATDAWAFGVRWETGKVVQSPNSAHKIADYPQSTNLCFGVFPSGPLTVKRSESDVRVDLKDFHVICRDDRTWHFSIEDKEKGIKAEWDHEIVGLPMWYGKEKPSLHTLHNRSWGYMSSGTVEGTLTIEGREVKIKGKGARDRWWALDVDMGEVGGWPDWMWFHFDEVKGEMVEMKLGKCKDLAIYLIDEKKYIPAGVLNIEHYDWAYHRALGVFIPTRYRVTVETEAGVLEFATNVVGCTVWAATGDVPDVAFLTLAWDKLDGTFTYKDGRKRTLTNGIGGTQNAIWKPYPPITTFIPELAVTEIPAAVVNPSTA